MFEVREVSTGGSLVNSQRLQSDGESSERFLACIFTFMDVASHRTFHNKLLRE